MQSPVLWSNEARTITVMDVCQSIADAQRNETDPFNFVLMSDPPLDMPFAANEPKSATAKAKVLATQRDTILHDRYHSILEEALAEVRAHHQGLWCMPRPFTRPNPRATKRRRDDSESHEDVENEQTTHDLPSDLLHRLARDSGNTLLNLSGSAEEDIQKSIDARSLCVNDSLQTTRFKMISTTHDDPFTFYFPPKSSYHIGDCRASLDFRNAVRNHAQDNDRPLKFDFILLDPPWPNRSVRRTHKTPDSTYQIAGSLGDVRDLLDATNIDMLIARDGWVGMWITNKPAVRDMILSEGGLFDCWGLELVEEWLWLKVTTSGLPVLPLDGLWRKPYEVLLMGRKREVGKPLSPSDPQHRVIISVSDMHSRKPCLKRLIEPLLGKGEDYRALEVFARHLVAGWCSWGNECIRFNWTGFWRDPNEAVVDER